MKKTIRSRTKLLKETYWTNISYSGRSFEPSTTDKTEAPPWIGRSSTRRPTRTSLPQKLTWIFLLRSQLELMLTLLSTDKPGLWCVLCWIKGAIVGHTHCSSPCLCIYLCIVVHVSFHLPEMFEVFSWIPRIKISFINYSLVRNLTSIWQKRVLVRMLSLKEILKSHFRSREERVATRHWVPKEVNCEVPHSFENETKHYFKGVEISASRG